MDEVAIAQDVLVFGVEVNVSHTNISDLSLRLLAPDQTGADLFATVTPPVGAESVSGAVWTFSVGALATLAQAAGCGTLPVPLEGAFRIALITLHTIV